MQPWIGCSGWQYPEWAGKFYPATIPKLQWFKYYTQHFNSVEINYSFYHNITEKNLIKWREAAPDNFRYSLKVHRLITHYKKFHKTNSLLETFYKKIAVLENKLGCILFQLPQQLHFNEAILENIISQLDLRFNNVIEFRHPSWWCETVFQTFKKNNIIFCTIDAPKLPQDLFVTQQRCYIRLHGRHQWYRGNYSKTLLSHWCDKMQQQQVEEAWVYFNNTASTHAPYNALELQNLLQTKKP